MNGNKHRLLATPHGTLRYDPDDVPVGRSLEVYGEWAEAEIEILAQVLRPGDTVVDVGAGIGTHALFFSRAVGAAGRVFAFEPDADAYALLESNIRLNALDNVVSERSALGDSGRTIDALNLSACRLLKIDTDGDDCAVLRGALETIARLNPIVLVECNETSAAREGITLLLGRGYSLYWQLVFAFRRNNRKAHATDVFNGGFDVNILALPKTIRGTMNNFAAVTGPDDTWQNAVERSRSVP